MRSLVLSLAFLFTAFFNANAQEDVTIKVKLNGGPADRYIHLAHFFGNNQYLKVDSAKLENGAYTFTKPDSVVGGIFLIVLSPSKYYDFIVSGDEKNIEISADTTDFMKTVMVKGSKENNVLFGYRKFLMGMNDKAKAINESIDPKAPDANQQRRDKMMGLQQEVENYMAKTIEDNKGTFAAKVIKANIEPVIPKEIPLNADGTKDSTFAYRYYKAHFFDNIDFSDPRTLRTPFLENKLDKFFKDLVYQVADSVNKEADILLTLSKQNEEVYRYVLWKITNKYENTDIVGLEGVFVHLAEEYYIKDAPWLTKEKVKEFEDRVRILKPLITGKVFPELYVYDLQENLHTVSESNGKYTIVYFYSPDCGHCKEAAPELVEFAKTAKDKGIVIYNVSVDYEPKEMQEFMDKYHTADNMLNLWDKGHHHYFREHYDVYATPTSYILDANKRIIAKRIPIKEFDKFIEFYEKKPKS